MEFISVDDYARHAGEHLAPTAFDYYRSGAHDERTLARNKAAFSDYELHYRVLVDVSRRSTVTTVLGHSVASPILVAPTAFHRLACEAGELATVRAAGRAGTAMCLSTLSNTDVEEVTAQASGPVFFQLYVYKDRGATQALVGRAVDAGCQALVLTVDAPLLGTRERDVRNRFQLPSGLSIRNMLADGLGDLPADVADSGLAAYFATLLDQALTFRDVEWLASISPLPVVVKGIVRPEDAARAVEHGASAVVVSNHGGRQLDDSPATIDVLASIVDVVTGGAEVWMDGGIRRGTDVLKALAIGARAVLVGRPILWGLSVSGEEGAAHVLEILRAELDLAMALCGCPSVSDITRDLVRRRG